MHAGTLCGRDALTLKFLSLPSAQPPQHSKIVRPFGAELRLELLVVMMRLAIRSLASASVTLGVLATTSSYAFRVVLGHYLFSGVVPTISASCSYLFAMLTKELFTAEQVQSRFIEPMYAEAVRELPDSGDWTYEAKLDGYRCLGMRRKRPCRPVVAARQLVQSALLGDRPRLRETPIRHLDRRRGGCDR
jgi:hypothetical protein